ncbi:MAG: HAD family hydrolase [Polyangiaceae bacterium]|nr:HAD family hydrolase [Polyangiaceae bacterium]
MEGALGLSPSAFYPRRLASNARGELLKSLIAMCKLVPGQPAPVLVFDLDGTLLDNRPRVAQIFRELADTWRDRHPREAQALAAVASDDIVYGIKENLARLGVVDPTLVDEACGFWKDRFFTDEYLRYDTETPGARPFVRACYDAGATVVYLTGRDLPNMALGTFASLRDLGFPIGVVGTSLVTKPAFDIPDADFKHEVAPSLVRHGNVVATFDNEPANCNLFLKHLPAARCVFLDTHHAPDPPALDPRAVVLDSFAPHG